MKELVRNSPHSNGITTLNDMDKRCFIKSSFGTGSENLGNEMAGFQWYMERHPSKIIKPGDYSIRYGNDGKYVRFFIKDYKGEKISPYAVIEKKLYFIYALIDHYFLVWNRQDYLDKYPIHGDYSVGNCVLKNGEIIVFDWEHFCKDFAPFGFDIVNLYYENIFFAIGRRENIKKAHINIFKKLKLSIMGKLKNPLDFKVDLKYLQNYLTDNCQHWGISFKKLPVLQFSSKHINLLNKLDL